MNSFSDSYLKSSLNRIKEIYPELDDREARKKLESEIDNYIEVDDLVRIKETGEIGVIANNDNDKYTVNCGDSSKELFHKDLIKLSVDDILKDNVFLRKRTAEVEIDKTDDVKLCMNEILENVNFEEPLNISDNSLNFSIISDALVGKEVSLKYAPKFGKVIDTDSKNAYLVKFSDGSESLRWLQELKIY